MQTAYLRHVLVALFLLLLGAGERPAQAAEVIVNGQRLSPAAIHSLQAAYQTRLPGGRYWYDPVSGLWGLEGGPYQGQIAPGLKLGGRLRADASAGNTGVFVNGRELHWQEVRRLQNLFGRVNRGRYWLNANGIGGYEGGPPRFDLNAAGRRGRGYHGANSFGYTGSDGRCSYVYIPESGYVMNGC